MKIRFYLALAAAALVMINCSQEEELVKAPNASKTINATIEGASRSAVTDAGVFSWTSGDAISVHDGTNYDLYNYSGNGNGFTLSDNQKVTTATVAYYPANESHTSTAFYLPDTYGNTNTEYVASTNAAMIATPPTQGNDYAFMHLGGVMRFNVKNVPAGATGFKFTASGKNISGNFDVKDNNGVKTIETTDGQSNTVSILFQASNVARDMTFYVPMPVGEYGNYTVALIIGNDEKGYESTNVTNNIARKTLLLMPTFIYNETSGELEKSTAKVGVIDLEDGNQTTTITNNADVVVTPGTDADATATLNYTPAQDGTSVLSISDGTGATESGESEGKVVVSTSQDATIASCDINTPNLTVELSAADGTEVTYGEVTALTAQQTLIIGKGVTITKLTGNGGNVLINGGKVQEWSKGKGENITITYVAKDADKLEIPTYASVVELYTDVTLSTTLTLDRSITLDGKGHTLTCTMTGTNGRAINVSGENVSPIIQNLTIKTSGERGVNLIQNAYGVTIQGTTIEAGNYAVNVAASAEGANVLIEKSKLTGLNTVNIGGSNVNITIIDTNITCADNSSKESYSAIAFNQNATKSTVAVTGGTITVEGDSYAVGTIPEDSEFTFEGTTGDIGKVKDSKYYIEYGNYAYSFVTFEQALAKVKNGETICLSEDVTLTNAMTIPVGKDITIDLKGHDITAPDTDVFVVEGTLTINDENNEGVVTAGSNNPVNGVSAVWAKGGTVTINGGYYKVHADQAGKRNDCIYAGHNADNANTAGNITINGGKFEYVWPEGEKNYTTDYNGDQFLLNCADKDLYETKITVNGGQFKNHVPEYENVTPAGRTDKEVELGTDKYVYNGETLQTTAHSKEAGDMWYEVKNGSGNEGYIPE